MRKKRIIISIVLVICVLVGIFFIINFGVVGRINNGIDKSVLENKAGSEEKGPEEFRYETKHDKNGNEYVVEYRKENFTDAITGKEVEMWGDTTKKTIIYSNQYLGKIEKIEDNKIYFMVDKEDKSGEGFSFKNVKDYKIIFDIDTYDLEFDPSSGSGGDFLQYLNGDQDILGNFVNCRGADELEFLLGKYLRAQAFMNEDPHTGDTSKTLVFYLK